MALYLLNVGLICVWGLLCFGIFKNKKIGKLLFLAICFTQLLLLVCFRYRIGFDYDMYAQGFVLMDMEGFSSLSYLDWEIGFIVLTKLIGLFTNNIQVYIGLIAVFCLFSWAFFIYRYSPNVCLSTFFFVNMCLLYLNMNFLRQAVAIAITLFAWPFIKNRKFWPFLGIVVLAALFHTTALILIPVYAVLRIRPGSGLWLLYAYGLLFFYISSEGIINLLTMVFHQEYANSVFLEGMSSLYALIPLLLLVLVYLFRKPMQEANEYNRYLIGFLFFAAFCMMMMTRHAILERISYYAYAYFVLALPELTSALRTAFPQGKKAALPAGGMLKRGRRYGNYTQSAGPGYRYWVVMGIIIVLTSGYHIIGLLENVHGVVPYASLFGTVF